MNPILVSGLINLEITLGIDSFPFEYSPVRYPFFGVNSNISGVGFNVASALAALGDEVRFCSIIGRDSAGDLALSRLAQRCISTENIVQGMEQTAHSVIIYDNEGKRAINVDLKDIQDREYPEEAYFKALEDCRCAVLCNINFSRPYLEKTAGKNIMIATDVHAISSLDDDYNADFMRRADLLFMSDELLPDQPHIWIKKTMERYGNKIVIVGLGSRGAMMGVRDEGFTGHFPAVKTRDIVNTIGAGDAMFSSFLHFYLKTGNPFESIKRAMVFASYKIGEPVAASGFLDEESLEKLYLKHLSN